MGDDSLRDHPGRMQGWESVCWGGSPYFRLFNVRWFPWIPLLSAIQWKSLKFKTMIFHKYQKCMRAKNFKTMIFHKYQECTRAKKSKNTMGYKYQKCKRTSILGQMIGHSLKNMLIRWDLLYDFAFCQNKWSLKIFQNVLWTMSFKNAKIYQYFLGGGGPKKISKTKKGVWWVPLWQIFEVRESWDMKK